MTFGLTVVLGDISPNTFILKNKRVEAACSLGSTVVSAVSSFLHQTGKLTNTLQSLQYFC